MDAFVAENRTFHVRNLEGERRMIKGYLIDALKRQFLFAVASTGIVTDQRYLRLIL